MTTINRRSLLAGISAGVALAAAPRLVLGAAETPRIGFLGPLTGPLAFAAQTNLNCINIAIDEINAAGGINGQNVELIVEDTQMSTRIAVDKARKLFSADQVFGITGMILPAEREAALSAAVETQGFVVYPNADEGRCHPNLLTTGLSPQQVIAPLVEWISSNVGTTVYAIMSDLAANREVLLPLLETELAARGGKLVASSLFPFGTRDYGPELQRVASVRPDAVFHFIGDDPNTFVKQYASFGIDAQLVSQLIHEAGAAVTGDALNGAIGFESYYMSVDTPENKVFLETYNQRFEHFTDRRTRGMVSIQPHGERSYVAVRILAEAARLGGGWSMDSLKAGLPQVEIKAPRGRVTIDSGLSHTVSTPFVGKVAPDHGIDVISELVPGAPVCQA